MNAWMSGLEQFHFLRPYWLAASLPALILFLLLWRKTAAAGNWRKIIAPHLLPYLLQGHQTRDSKTPLIMLLTAWILASVAMAGPTWQQLPAAVKKKIDARVIVLDLTLSMLATDTPPSRLVRAKYKLSDILSRSKEGLTGLVVFAGSAHVVSPLTDDSNTILSLASSLTPDIMPISGSDPLSAIKQAADVLKAGGVPDGQILFIGDDLPDDYAEALAPLKDNISLSILAVGTGDGAPIALGDGRYLKDAMGSIVLPKVNHPRLREAAATFGGRYTALAADDADINYLLADFLNLDDEVRESRREFDVWDDLGAWMALLILPLAAAGYRRGWLGAWFLPLLFAGSLLQTGPARADLWDSLWKNGDQQGKQAFDEQHYEQAADLFKTPEWKAGALYKSGKYQEAEALYKNQSNADGHYNRGNALAQQGKLEEAEQAYNEALKLAPDMADAKANQETVQKLLKKKQQEQQQSGQNGKNGSDKQSSGQSKDQQAGDEQSGNEQSANEQSANEQSANEQSGKDGQQNDSQGQQDGQTGKDQPPQQGGDKNAGDNNPDDKPDAADKKAQADGEQSAQDAQKADGKSGEESQAGALDDPPASASTEPLTEDQQAMEQWLRRVPDDPGGLLRRKFYYESRLRRNAENQTGTPW